MDSSSTGVRETAGRGALFQANKPYDLREPASHAGVLGGPKLVLGWHPGLFFRPREEVGDQVVGAQVALQWPADMAGRV